MDAKGSGAIVLNKGSVVLCGVVRYSSRYPGLKARVTRPLFFIPLHCRHRQTYKYEAFSIKSSDTERQSTSGTMLFFPNTALLKAPFYVFVRIYKLEVAAAAAVQFVHPKAIVTHPATSLMMFVIFIVNLSQ